jgi:hypothetical protein
MKQNDMMHVLSGDNVDMFTIRVNIDEYNLSIPKPEKILKLQIPNLKSECVS